MQVPVTELIPGGIYRVVRPSTGQTFTATFIRHRYAPEGAIIPFPPIAELRRNNGTIASLSHTLQDWTYYDNINEEIIARNGALGPEHADFRAQLIEQLGAEEAARRLANPEILSTLAKKRRKNLLTYRSRTHPWEIGGGRKRKQTRRRRHSKTRK